MTWRRAGFNTAYGSLSLEVQIWGGGTGESKNWHLQHISNMFPGHSHAAGPGTTL